ncbi:DUF3871 family protein [Robiginitalea sp. SC105]|nr:DUF3871 family protein [Robiginitalea sp. SC105]
MANTREVSLDHLRDQCIIPVFSKDNETTIAHHEFIEVVCKAAQAYWPGLDISIPQIRVSHVVKGRIPSAIGKPASALLDHEKTIYYERCAFQFEISGEHAMVAGNPMRLSIGGVRAYNQENLYSRKSLERFKVFVGYRNQICMNLCVRSDGFVGDLRVGSKGDLLNAVFELIAGYDPQGHLEELGDLEAFELSEEQFAHLIGKLRMYPHLSSEEKDGLPEISLTDGQINTVVRDYYSSEAFGRDTDGQINLWRLYNLLTEANKSSYIDSFLVRSLQAHGLVNNLAKSLRNGVTNWLLNN